MNAPIRTPSNATAHLLSLTDSQLKFCSPNVWPCQVIEAFGSRLAVLQRFYPVCNRRGVPETFPVITVWASHPAEMHCFSTSFSVS